MIVVAAFAILLLLGIPISMVVLSASAAGLMAYTTMPLQAVIQQMFSGLNNYTLLAIPFFIISGTIASRGKTSEYLARVMNLIFGRLKGGGVIATIAACAFFAAISGSSVATIVAVGSIMIPNLVKNEYPESLAIGTVTSGGSIGILIPPSAPMIALCVALNCSVGKMFIAGVIPGLLLALAWAVYAYIICRKNNWGTYEKVSLKEGLKTVFKAIPALIYPVIVLGTIYGGYATPTESAAISIVYVVIVELFIYRTTSLKELFFYLKDGLISSAGITLIVSAAQVLTYLVTIKQIPAAVCDWISANVTANWQFLAIVIVLFFVAGCFMELVALMVVLGPILSPSLEMLGINPIHFGIICIMAAQISYITPPFGLNLFISMKENNKGLGYVAKASLPYLIILIGCMLLVAFVEPISTWLPDLMH
ncbi:TRAP transporter large permease [Pseudoflavonifractor sp.]|jgi:C4-dicarboxylate transporter DctM subunit|uniref:TRAP transporter large permease n=1 Tax=Pseudoflavonifractor sp. TaxID=1980281 RepID=UPI003D944B02